MGRSFGLGREFGVEVKVHWTFFLLLAFFGALGFTRTGSLLGTALVAGLILLLFLFVLLRRVWPRPGRRQPRQRGRGHRPLAAFPTDGGRVLRAFLSTRMDRVRATDLAATVGQAFAAFFFAVGLLSLDVILTLVAVFVFDAAGARDAVVRVRDSMRTEFPMISPRADLLQEGVRLLQENDFRTLPVCGEGELVGLLGIEDIGKANLLRKLPAQEGGAPRAPVRVGRVE